MGIFDQSADPAAIEEARRLAWRAAGAWVASWILPAAVAAVLSGPQSGEMAMLGAIGLLAAVLLFGGAGTVLSLRLSIQAFRLDPTSGLVWLMIGLGILSMVFVLIIGGLTLTDLAG